MSASRHRNRFAAFLRLGARLLKLRREHPVVYDLIALILGLLLAAFVLAVEWWFR